MLPYERLSEQYSLGFSRIPHESREQQRNGRGGGEGGRSLTIVVSSTIFVAIAVSVFPSCCC